MNKKLLISLASLIILLAIVLLISNSLHRNKTVILGATFNTDISGLFGYSTEPVVNTVSSSSTLVCPDGFEQITLVGMGGNSRKTCVPLSTQGDYPIGDGSQSYDLLGYYSTYDKPKYTIDYDPTRDPTPATTTCSAITVTGGNSDFIKVYEKMVIEGNTVNHVDDNGNLVLNINLNDVTAEQQYLILKSDKDAPLNLSVKALGSEGREADYCESFIAISSVK